MSKPRILLVEDESIVATIIYKDLKDMGYDPIDVVDTGELAIAKARELRPDLILMDIQLPGEIDGVEVATQIVQNPGCPVIFLSGSSDQAVLDRAKISEPYGYLIKPVNKLELNAMIQITLYKVKVEHERADLLLKLQDALEEIKVLHGMLPICACCKKIRDDSGYWHQIESYIAKHSEANFTHGVCPECKEKLLGYKKKNNWTGE